MARSDGHRRAVAELIAVGSELTQGRRQDTNTVWLRNRLANLQVEVRRVTALGDRVADLTGEIRRAARRASLVVMTGGLGPTDDDRTLEAMAAAAGRRLRLQPTVKRWLGESLGSRRLADRPELLRQARLPVGARPRRNRRGTAPAVMLESEAALLVALPGVPDEMKGLWLDGLERDLERRFGPATDSRALVTVGGRRESDVDGVATPVCRRCGVALTVLAGGGVVELHLSGDSAAVSVASEDIACALGEDVVCAGGRSLEQVVLDLATAAGGTLAVAESCTGGRVASRLTAVPGASQVFLGGITAYANAMKQSLLAVPKSLLRRHGAVSRQTAEKMVAGLRRLTGCTWGVAVTGVAGPGGGSRSRPVGTVWIAAGGPEGLTSRRWRLPGGRDRVQELAAGLALDQLRRIILKASP